MLIRRFKDINNNLKHKRDKMITFQNLMTFIKTLIKLITGTFHYYFYKIYKMGRIHIIYNKLIELVKKGPIQLELLSHRQLKVLQFEHRLENNLYIIPIYLRHLLPKNLYVYEKYTKEKGLISDFPNSIQVGIIPHNVEYKNELLKDELTDGFFFYLRNGYFPND